jgi:hypothetical protein
MWGSHCSATPRLTPAVRCVCPPAARQKQATNSTAEAEECTGTCLMMQMMEEKRVHFAECRAESKLTHGAAGCPTIRPSTTKSVPCEEGQSGEYACSGVDLLSYVGMEELGSSETNDICE